MRISLVKMLRFFSGLPESNAFSRLFLMHLSSKKAFRASSIVSTASRSSPTEIELSLEN